MCLLDHFDPRFQDYFTTPGAPCRFINWCYADREQIWSGNNYKIIQKQRTNPTSECKLLLMHWIAIFWPYIFQFWKLNLTVIIGECVGISLIVLSNNNLEQFKTLKYPRERERVGWLKWCGRLCAVLGCYKLGIVLMLNRGDSIINYNDDPQYRELTNKDSIDCILSSTSIIRVFFKDLRRS